MYINCLHARTCSDPIISEQLQLEHKNRSFASQRRLYPRQYHKITVQRPITINGIIRYPTTSCNITISFRFAMTMLTFGSRFEASAPETRKTARRTTDIGTSERPRQPTVQSDHSRCIQLDDTRRQIIGMNASYKRRDKKNVVLH